ncbi:MAG: hypothetical protein GF308_17415 [Candidatus Heimdallarchaeota archaeon]|nr:hypothetical protein [Candidatus Heimdallarchaeota archaeon]
MKFKRISLAFILIVLVSFPLVPRYISGWKQETSNDLTRPNFSTTQWLGYEAVSGITPEAKMTWITENLLSFWLGVEAPHNSEAASGYVNDTSIYGDVEDLVLYLDASGTTVTNSSLADRAQEEYDKLIMELGKEDADLTRAAFHAGAMAHYVSQAGVWGALWDESLWGTLNTTIFALFENQIDDGCVGNHLLSDQSSWRNEYFEITVNATTPMTAEEATIDLAEKVFPLAQALGNNFNTSATSVEDWSEPYRADVGYCLNRSVEAIINALEQAMTDVNWKYLSVPTPTVNYSNETGEIAIPELKVNYTDNNGTQPLTDALATNAEFYYVVHPTDFYGNYQTPYRTDAGANLTYSSANETWYFSEEFVPGLTARTDHSIVLFFQMTGSAEFYSERSEMFYVNYFFINVTKPSISYNSKDRTLDVKNIRVNIPDFPELGSIDPSEANLHHWYLYTRGEGTSLTEETGVRAYNTWGDQINGQLEYNESDETWYSIDNDIGWVFTQTLQVYFVVVRFNVSGIPIGFFKQSIGGSQRFYTFVENASSTFTTRDHQITISKPKLEYNQETQTVRIWDVTAHTDYKNLTLDYEMIEGREIWDQLEDKRMARWKIFLYDGIASSRYGDLEWDPVNEWWFAEDIYVGTFPDNNYYIACKIVNLNVNVTTSPYGPPSDYFHISRPIPIVYWILPEIFLAGFVVLFGWLAWYRPKKKKEEREASRQARIGRTLKEAQESSQFTSLEDE